MYIKKKKFFINVNVLVRKPEFILSETIIKNKKSIWNWNQIHYGVTFTLVQIYTYEDNITTDVGLVSHQLNIVLKVYCCIELFKRNG